MLIQSRQLVFLGSTKGSTKRHNGLKEKSTRVETSVKMLYCIKTKKKSPTSDYVSSWRAETKEEKDRAKRINKYKKEILGVMF